MFRLGVVLVAAIAAGCAQPASRPAADASGASGTRVTGGTSGNEGGLDGAATTAGGASGWWSTPAATPSGGARWGIVRAAGGARAASPDRPNPPATSSSAPASTVASGPSVAPPAPAPAAPLVSEGASPAGAHGTSRSAPASAAGAEAGPVTDRPAPSTSPSNADTTAGATTAAALLLQPEEEIEDEVEDAEPPPSQPAVGSTPAIAPISDAEMRRLLQTTPGTLGPLSVGAANGGALFNGKPLPASPMWDIIDPGNAWGTDETIRYLTAAVAKVRARFPDAPKMQIGHLSAKHGGPLKPHRSHQSGRDVDTSFFYRVEQPGWYRRATADNLDRAKTWAFVRALLTETDVEYIFINTSIQRLLRDYALAVGEDPEWLDSVFQVGGKRADAIIRHARGHDTHIHVRFYNPKAQELGRRAYPHLLALGRIKPSQYFVKHKAVKGDTLGSLARKYDTTVAAIQRANKLRGTLIMAKQVYLIPKERASLPQSGPVQIPPRRLPPAGLKASGAGAKPPSASSAP